MNAKMTDSSFLDLASSAMLEICLDMVSILAPFPGSSLANAARIRETAGLRPAVFTRNRTTMPEHGPLQYPKPPAERFLAC